MIKKIIPLLLGIILGCGASAQVQWHTIDQANAAKIGTRIYFADFYTTWCGYCKKMDRETFSDKTVAKILNTYYYPFKFDAESNATVKWFKRTYSPIKNGRNNIHEFAVATLGSRMGFPTFAFFRADGTLLQTVPGYYNAHDFTIILWYFASGDCDKYPFDRYQQIFDKEIRPTMDKVLSNK